MPTNPDREALLRDAQPFVEARHEQRVQGFVVGLSEDAALECLDIIERLATALREEMAKQDPEWICREGHTFRYSDGKGCPHCLTQARANLRRVAEATRRDIGNRIKGEMKREHSAAISAARLAQIVETDTNIDAILAQLDAEAEDVA